MAKNPRIMGVYKLLRSGLPYITGVYRRFCPRIGVQGAYRSKGRSYNRSALQLGSIITMLFCMGHFAYAQERDMMIRIAEIEIYPQHLEEYRAILKYEAEASVRLEEGVIAIFPMFIKENPTEVRILEIYEDRQAYQDHLKTEHFLAYKTMTLHMVKSLKLVDMDVLDPETMNLIFSKLAGQE